MMVTTGSNRELMVSQQGPATAQPAPTPASLREQMKATQVSLDDALARRAGIVARIDAAGGPGERVRLRNGELRGVDGQVSRFKAELAGLEAELQYREAIAANPPIQPVLPEPALPPVPIDVAPTVPPTASTTVPPGTGIGLDGMVLGGVLTVFVLAPLAFAIAWRVARRGALAGRRPEWEEHGARLARMEEAIAAIALDVDRVSESQRFLTKALVAEATSVREEVRTRS